MLIPIEYYAMMYQRPKPAIMQRCITGRFSTAKKMGRNWFIDENEPFSDNRSPMTKFEPIEVDAPRLPENMIPLTEYAVSTKITYKALQKAAIENRLPTAIKIGNQWFIEKDTIYISRNL